MTQGTDAEAIGRQWWRWLLAGVALPVVGAAAVVGLIEGAGGDLGDVGDMAGRRGTRGRRRRPGGRDRVARAARRRAAGVAWAVVCAGLQLALVFGVGFVALGLGPG